MDTKLTFQNFHAANVTKPSDSHSSTSGNLEIIKDLRVEWIMYCKDCEATLRQICDLRYWAI